MKTPGMTGLMAAWCDTDKPMPIRIRRVDYLPPISGKLVEALYERVKNEPAQKLTGFNAQQRVYLYELRERMLERIKKFEVSKFKRLQSG